MSADSMCAIYTDENVDYNIVEFLRERGHDVLTAFEDGRANLRIDDPKVLARSVELGRVVLTNNRKHYHRLHRRYPAHFGIVTYTEDKNLTALAERIHHAITGHNGALAALCIRVCRPG